jgi:hypothetical protein
VIIEQEHRDPFVHVATLTGGLVPDDAGVGRDVHDRAGGLGHDMATDGAEHQLPLIVDFVEKRLRAGHG